MFLLARLPVPRSVPAALAFDQLRGAPGQATVSLATIVASVSLMVSMAIMVASFRHSLDDWLVRILPADLYVRAGSAGDSTYFSADDQHKFAGLRGVHRVDFLRGADPAQPRVALLARAWQTTRLARRGFHEHRAGDRRWCRRSDGGCTTAWPDAVGPSSPASARLRQQGAIERAVADDRPRMTLASPRRLGRDHADLRATSAPSCAFDRTPR